MLGRRDPLHYGTLTLAELERADRSRGARELGLRGELLPDQPEGEFVEHLHALRGQADGGDPQPRRLDALRWAIHDALEIDRAAGRRGAPLRRRDARAVAAGVGDRRSLLRDDLRPRPRRLRRRARALRERARRRRRVTRRAVERRASVPGARRAPGRRAARARARRAARRDRRQRALPDRLHRHQRAGADRGARRRPRRPPLPHRLPLRRPSRPSRSPDASSARSSPAICSSAPSSAARRRDARRAAGLRRREPHRHAARAPAASCSARRWELVPCAGAVERLRAVKDAGEIARIRAASRARRRGAARRCSKPASSAAPSARSRSSSSCACAGSAPTAPSFPSIVAAGAHGALPHAEPRAREIRADVLVTIDWGALHEGYCSDCTRTYATGERDLRAGARGLRARARGPGARRSPRSRAGPSGREVDAVAREVIERGRPRRALRPRPRSRRRHGDPRGPAPVAHRRRGAAAGRQRRDGRARRLPARACSACGSRICVVVARRTVTRC